MEQTKQDLILFKKFVENLHSGAEIAYRQRSGWKIHQDKAKTGYYVSLRAFVQGKKMIVADIRARLEALGDDQPGCIDVSCYKDREQLLCMIKARKSVNDRRTLEPLTHQNALRAFLVQDVENCQLVRFDGHGPSTTMGKRKGQRKVGATRNEQKKARRTGDQTAKERAKRYTPWLAVVFGCDRTLIKDEEATEIDGTTAIPINSTRCSREKHKSNHCYFTLTDSVARFKCHDTDCKKKAAEGQPFPEQTLPSGTLIVFSERLNEEFQMPKEALWVEKGFSGREKTSARYEAFVACSTNCLLRREHREVGVCELRFYERGKSEIRKIKVRCFDDEKDVTSFRHGLFDYYGQLCVSRR